MNKVLIITPPYTACNKPSYGSAMLKSRLSGLGIEAAVFDLSVELVSSIFTAGSLTGIFNNVEPAQIKNPNIKRIYALRQKYIDTIDSVIDFLKGRNIALANVICGADYIPQAGRFESVGDIETLFGQIGTIDCARYISSLYLQDLADFIRETNDLTFGLSGETDTVKSQLSLLDNKAIGLISEQIDKQNTDTVCFCTETYDGMKIAAVYADAIKQRHGDLKFMLFTSLEYDGVEGGFDFIISRSSKNAPENIIKAIETPALPDYGDININAYLPLAAETNPALRFGTDGCRLEVSLGEAYDEVNIVDFMEETTRKTQCGTYSLTGKTISPENIKALSIGLIRRKLRFTWQVEVQYSKGFTGDLCQLMAQAGCVAVNGDFFSPAILRDIDHNDREIERTILSLRNFCYAGIMTTIDINTARLSAQQALDMLEITRQTFRAELITACRCDAGKRNSRIDSEFEAAVISYIKGEHTERTVNKWFQGMKQPSIIEDSLITDQLIKPDSARLFNAEARLIWLGGDVYLNENGVEVHTNSTVKNINWERRLAEFIVEICRCCSQPEKPVTMEEIKNIYSGYSDEPFAVLYHSKKWDIMRGLGLLQI